MLPYNPPYKKLKLSGEKLRDLGWEAKRGIKEMFERMLTA
jgi:hypothetical protein